MSRHPIFTSLYQTLEIPMHICSSDCWLQPLSVAMLCIKSELQTSSVRSYPHIDKYGVLYECDKIQNSKYDAALQHENAVYSGHDTGPI